MRHLMWILTWIAVGIGGALGAASVLMLTASRHPASVQSPDVIAGGGNDKVVVTKPKPGNSIGRSAIMGVANRHAEMD